MSNPVQILMVIDAKCCENETKKILFPCLKLLTHFSGQLDKNAPKVKWGHNFYNCPRSIIAKHRRRSFTDFTEDSFKEFENDIRCVAELISNQTNYPMNSLQLPPAKIIERALTESLYDYPWVKPDLSSPDARNKSKMNVSTGEPQQLTSQNVMFLIAACPNSCQQLCHFFGDKNFTAFSFINPSLQQLFGENDNVRLLWVDIGTTVANMPNDVTQQEQDKSACTIAIRNELRKTNGDLIPSRIFLQLEPRLRFPLSSLVSYYLDMDVHQKDTCISGRVIFPHESTHEVCNLELCALTKNTHRAKCTTRSKAKSSLSLVPIGTINETEISPQSFKVCNEFVCFYKSDTAIDINVERKMQNFMVTLKTRNLAMVVSCNHSNVGIISPFADTKMGVCGILYILDEIECNISSTDHEKLPITPKDVPNTSNTFSADVSEPWFIPESFPSDVKSLLDSNVDTTKPCHPINGQLRQFYLSSVEKKKPQTNADTESQNPTSSPKGSDVGNFSFSDRSAKIMAKSKIKKALEANQRKLLNDTDKFSHMEQLKSKQEDLQNKFTRLMADQASLLDEIQLRSRVMDLYTETVVGHVNIVDGAKSIVHLMYHFSKATSENPKDFMEKMRQECLRKDASGESTETKSSEVKRCMINVLWELEAHLVSVNEQDANDVSDKVTAQLRMIPIHSDIATLSTFLQDVIFENYYPILENVLSNVCEELNFPMPIDGEATCSSPAASLIGDITDNESRSPSSISVASNPRSNSNLLACHQEKRSRVVGKHPSFADLMQVRQISLPKKEVVKKHVTNSTEADNSKGRKSARKARRNLFDDKSKDNPSSPESRSRDKCFTPNGKRVLKTKVVAETPERKQVSNVIRARQACLRRLNMGDPTDVEVIEESPNKGCSTARSRLFYSSSQNSLHSTSIHAGQNVQHYLLSPTKLNETQLTTQHRSSSIVRGRYNHGLLKRKCDNSDFSVVSPAAKTFVTDSPDEQLEICVPTTPEKLCPQNTDSSEERVISTPLRYGMESPTQHNFILLDKLDCNNEESQCELSPSIPLLTCQRSDSPDASIHSSEDLNEHTNGSDQVVDDQNQERNSTSPTKKPGNWSSPSVKSLLHLTSSPIITSKF